MDNENTTFDRNADALHYDFVGYCVSAVAFRLPNGEFATQYPGPATPGWWVPVKHDSEAICFSVYGLDASGSQWWLADYRSRQGASAYQQSLEAQLWATEFTRKEAA